MSQDSNPPADDDLPSWSAIARRPPAALPPETLAPEPLAPEPLKTETLPPPAPSGNSSRPRSPSGIAIGVATAILLAGGILGGVLLLNQGSLPGAHSDFDESSDPATDAPKLLALSDAPNTSGVPAASPPFGGPATSLAPHFASPPGATSNESDRPVRIAIYSNGFIYLRGLVPSAEISAAIETRAASILGPDNVINEYTIDPDAPFDPDEGSPLYVHDLVLFESGSAVVAEPFTPLLGLGVSLLTRYPSVTITIIGHTDSAGSDDANLALSQARVQAVADYWIAAGIDPDRIPTTAFGETSPLGDNDTSEGRRVNRRVEFVIAGLLSD